MSLSHCDRISERVKGYQMELAGVLMSNGLIEHAGNIARAALIRPSFEDLDAEKVWHGMVWVKHGGENSALFDDRAAYILHLSCSILWII